MQQPNLVRQSVKIINFELFNQICHQLEYASLGRQNDKIINFELFKQISLQLGYATDEPWATKCQNYKL